MLFPPSSVSLFRTCILMYPERKAFRFVVLSASSRSRYAVGQNTNASPFSRSTIRSNTPSSPMDLLRAARWFLRAVYHDWDWKRWTMVTLHRSSKAGDSVGSWVAIMTLDARWRCCLMTWIRSSVRPFASLLSVRNCNLVSGGHVPVWSAYRVCFIECNYKSIAVPGPEKQW